MKNWIRAPISRILRHSLTSQFAGCRWSRSLPLVATSVTPARPAKKRAQPAKTSARPAPPFDGLEGHCLRLGRWRLATKARAAFSTESWRAGYWSVGLVERLIRCARRFSTISKKNEVNPTSHHREILSQRGLGGKKRTKPSAKIHSVRSMILRTLVIDD